MRQKSHSTDLSSEEIVKGMSRLPSRARTRGCPLAAELGTAVGEHTTGRNLVLIEERHHTIVHQVGGGERRLAVVELGEGHLGVGVDRRLLIDAPHALERADIECVLRHAIARAFALELAVRLLVELGLLECGHLRLGEHQALLRALSLQGIRRATRKRYSAEEKIRIVLDGLHGEHSIAELCRREGIAEGLYYSWSKEFLEAGKRRLAGETARAATSDEVKDLKRQAQELKEVVAEQALELRLLKKSMIADGGDEA